MEAEQTLASAIATLEFTSRADKMLVSTVVRESLQRLDEARERLNTLEALVHCTGEDG